QGEVVAIQISAIESNDCQCRAATVGQRYQEIVRILPREVRLFARIQLRQTSLLCTGGARRGASQSEVCRASSNRVDGPLSGGTVVRITVISIDDRRYSGRDQAA